MLRRVVGYTITDVSKDRGVKEPKNSALIGLLSPKEDLTILQNPSLCSDVTSRNCMGSFVGFSRLHYMSYGDDKNTRVEIFLTEDAKFRRDCSYPHPRISRSPIMFAKLS